MAWAIVTASFVSKSGALQKEEDTNRLKAVSVFALCCMSLSWVSCVHTSGGYVC